jgi:hypothetical protein
MARRQIYNSMGYTISRHSVTAFPPVAYLPAAKAGPNQHPYTYLINSSVPCNPLLAQLRGYHIGHDSLTKKIIYVNNGQIIFCVLLVSIS